jgi:LysR family hydrogen peroxide-inducible transcriptional activator
VAADELPAAAQALSDPYAGTVRLGVIPTISPYLLPEVAPALRERLPRVAFRWVEEKTAVLAGRLHDGSLEGAVVAVGPDLGDVESIPLATDPFVLAAARSHPLGKGRAPVRLGDLEGHDVLLLDDGHCLRDQALALCAPARARELSYRATSLATLVQMTAGGIGVTLLPLLSVAAENRHGELAIRPFARPAPARQIVLVHRRGTPAGRVVREVAEVLRARWPLPR